ncbi:MAG: alpha-L-rhamnosidase N-terminal domain-containing protein [Candidatus Marinimicrobia bacterium]|nr:alpha-L-rhamnosidase N-terminal domain-containing protein [Candidatus Neomarinimicrobiota bacterium]
MSALEVMEELTNEMSHCKRLWLGDENRVNAVRAFRRVFEIAGAVRRARLAYFADMHCHLWINGAYTARGPAFFHPHRKPVAHLDITAFLKPGKNCIAALVHAPGIALHNHVPSTCPGLVASLDVEMADGAILRLRTDARWKATERTGWRGDTPRRGWALAHIEDFDATHAPDDWRRPEFDDHAWPQAEEHTVFRPGHEGIFIDPQLPQLRFIYEPAVTLLFHRRVSSTPPPLTKDATPDRFGRALMEEARSNPVQVHVKTESATHAGTLHIEGFDGDEGALIALDMGKQHTGAVHFEMKSESDGIVDIGWSERLVDGVPCVLQKGVSYADRFHARPGRNAWMPAQFSSGRYLLLAVRGFRGTVRFHRLGMLTSEPALSWQGRFECSDQRLNRIWELCSRTLRVGTQEGLMDCPTREQATYAGDGHPTAEWIGRLTGDYSYWQHLIRETFAAQSDDGLVKSATFSGMRTTLIDYMLLSITGTERYLVETGDAALAREVLPACRKTLGWFEKRFDADGLFDMPWEAMAKHAPWVTNPATAVDALRNPGLNLFIDHPGLGWHNREEPGIDRRGTNAAINALIVTAMRSLAALTDAAGGDDAPKWRAEADALAERCARFWNPDKGVFADGILAGRLLAQISQQTNIWSLMAGVSAPLPPGDILTRILDVKDRDMARCGPYFWTYGLPILADHDLMVAAVDEIRRLWSPMLDAGATTLWETFRGDDLDSYCHPWSGAPVDFLPRHVAGIGSLPATADSITLTPALSLFERVSAAVVTPRGPVSLAWKRDGTVARLNGSLPNGVTGRLVLPSGIIQEVRNVWDYTVK